MKKIGLLILFINLSVQQVKSQCSFGSFPPAYTTTGSWTNGIWIAKMYALSTTATLTGLGLNANANSLTEFRMAIYDDAAGVPGNLVAAVNQATMVIGQNTVSVTTPTVIPAGNYWITAFYNSSGAPVTNGSSIAPFFIQYGVMATTPPSASTWTNAGNVDMDFWAVINTPLLSVGGPTAVCTGNTATLTASGAATYTWSGGSTATAVAVSPTTAATYTLSGTGANGCMATITPSLGVNPLPVISVSGTSTLCFGSVISQTVSGANTYSWNSTLATNPLTLSPNISFVYTVTGIDANGCTGSTARSLTVNPNPTLTVTGGSALCLGSSITQTVSGAGSYSWSSGVTTTTVSLSPASTVVYSVTGTSTAGCSSTLIRTITVNALPTVTILGNSSFCNGSSLTQTVSGASTYSWSTGATTSTITVAPATSTVYSATGTDVNGCVAIVNKSITVNPLPTLSVSGSSSVCANSSVTETVSGASTYSWNTGATTNTALLSPLVTTIYTITGTDANGCKSIITKQIVPLALPALVISGNNNVCTGSSVTQTVSGAATYSWNTGAVTTTVLISPTTTAVYSVTGTDANGCINTTAKTVTVNALPVLGIAGSSSVCAGASVTQTLSGAVSYSLNSTAVTSTVSLTPAANTVYLISGTDANGCIGTINRSLTVNALPAVIISGTNNVCVGSSITLTVSGAASYSWNTGAVTSTISVAPAVNTLYSVTGVDANGCSKAVGLAVTANLPPVLGITGNSFVCAGTALTQTVTGASFYSWTTGATTNTIMISPATTTVYTATGTSANGCSASITETVTVNPLPVLTASLSTAVLCTGETGTISASGASVWLWNTGATTMNLPVTPTITTTYTVTGTDAQGCSSSTTAVQQVNACTGIKEQNQNSLSVVVSPNPGNGLYNLTMNAVDEAATLEVYNASGILVKHEQLSSESAKLDLSDAASGLYYIIVHTGKNQQVLKVIKE